jgi:hypothetical protein
MNLRARTALLALSSVLVVSSCGDGASPTSPSDPVTIEIQTLAEAIEGQAYSQQLLAAGGRGSYTWALAAGGLPAGLTLAPTGTISGTPVGAGTASFRVRATDSSGQSATADLSILVVQALAIHTLTLADGVVDQAYNAQLEAVGGKGTYSWSLVGGEAASWLTVSSNGTLSGTPVKGGASSLIVELADASGQQVTREFTLIVLGPLAVAEISLPAAVQGRAYAAQLVATGGDGAYTWRLDSGTLPTRIGLQSGGALTGAPSVAGTFAFTVQVSDGSDRTATRALSLTVERAPMIQTQSLPPANLGVVYSTQLIATGGTGAYRWSLTEGALPTGLSLSSAGAITGIASVQGSSTFTVQVADEASITDTKPFTIVVADIVRLTSGVTVTGLTGDAESERYYRIDVPGGATGLTVVISGGTGDADLYIRRGALPQQFAYDCRPLRQGNEETCTVSSPPAGQWYVLIRGFAAYAGLSLTATVAQ